jgi:thiol-disulfide isomerase/thioredoxin
LTLAGCDRQSEPAPQPKAAQEAKSQAREKPGLPPAATGVVDRRNAGKPMPDISFLGPDGSTVRLLDFADGQPVLVNLWATWCGPCIVEMPTLDALAKREAGRMKVMAISQDLKGRVAVDRFWKEQKFSHLEPYIDQKADFSFAYGGGSLPTTILFGPDGNEVWRLTTALDWSGEEAKALLEEAMDATEGA